jgi:hypothetical protein
MPERLALPIHGPEHVPGGPDPIPFGDALFEIKVFEDQIAVEAGDGKFKFDVPEDLDTALLTKAEAWITSPAGGDVVVSLWNETQGVDLLATPLTIPAGGLNSKDGTPAVVDDTTNEVAWGDEIWVNVDNAGGMGLGVAVYFLSRAVNAIVVRGAKGEPGGVTEFEGDWSGSSVSYPAGSVVVHDGTAYFSTTDHTSSSTTEPGVGVDWATVWATLVDVPVDASLNCSVHSSQGPVPDGAKAVYKLPFSAVITEAMILADRATDCTFDLWKSDFGGYPPDASDSICGGTPPTLTGSIKNVDGTLTGWDTALAAGDLLVFWVEGVDNARRVTLILQLEKG